MLVKLSKVACLVAVLATLWSAVCVLGCANENDPQTWVKRLDDPSQRPAAVKRLSQFFEDGMMHANKDRNDPAVRALLEKIVQPLTKQYTAGNLDDKTRKELLKLLADTRDPRIAPALAKAFNEYEPGRTEDEVKYASRAVIAMGGSTVMTDANVIDALWNVFSKFQVSKAKSSNIVKDLHDAVLIMASPSYGPKAVDKLRAAVDLSNRDAANDQLEFWQKTAIQVVAQLRYTPAVRPLVKVLLTPSKAPLRSLAVYALLRMPKAADEQLVIALQGVDPEYSAIEAQYGADRPFVAILGDALALSSRPEGANAILSALSFATTASNRTILAQSLVRFPSQPALMSAFFVTYKLIPPSTDVVLVGGNAHAALVDAASRFYDPRIVDWLLREAATAKGDEADALPPRALESAIKLMTVTQLKSVVDAVRKDPGAVREREMFARAAPVVQRCREDAACYAAAVAAPIPSSPATANMEVIKAAWMAAVYGKGSDSVREALVKRVGPVKDPGARLAIVEAIDQLAPHGDCGAARTLEAIVEADRASGNADLLLVDDSVAKVALRLRARAE